MGYTVAVGPSDLITGIYVDLLRLESEVLDHDHMNGSEDWSENSKEDGDGVEAHVVNVSLLLNERGEGDEKFAANLMNVTYP